MSKLTYYSLAFAVLMVVVYVCVAASRKAKADLVGATHIAIATTGIGGAVRLIGFVFFGDFAQAAQVSDHGWWSLTGEDALFIIVGGLALLWVSIQQITAAFAELK